MYTHDGTIGVWRTSKTGNKPLPADWPPVPVELANFIEGDFQNPGETDNALLTFTPSTNGIIEYTASNFNIGLKGNLLAAAWDGSIFRISRTTDETNVTNAKAAFNKINQEAPFASGFGSLPLDVIAQGDDDIFARSGGYATAIKETITVQVSDGQLNLHFSAASAEGGVNRPKIAAIEVIPKTMSATTTQTLTRVRDKNHINATLYVYPNPNRGERISLEMKDFSAKETLQVMIYDMLGRVVQVSKLETNSLGTIQKELVLPVNLNKGVYTIVVYGEKERLQHKLVVQ